MIFHGIALLQFFIFFLLFSFFFFFYNLLFKAHNHWPACRSLLFKQNTGLQQHIILSVDGSKKLLRRPPPPPPANPPTSRSVKCTRLVIDLNGEEWRRSSCDGNDNNNNGRKVVGENRKSTQSHSEVVTRVFITISKLWTGGGAVSHCPGSLAERGQRRRRRLRHKSHN